MSVSLHQTRILSLLFLFSIPAISQIAGVRRMIIPGYPEIARFAGIQGIVSVDILPNGHSFVMSGPVQIAKSKVFDVMSEWKLTGEIKETIRINFDFIILEPDDPSFKLTMNGFTEIISPDTIRIFAKKNLPLK